MVCTVAIRCVRSNVQVPGLWSIPVKITPSGECCKYLRSKASSASGEYPVTPISM
ncbi:hypothetical protein D3C78_1517410 [compost metagenome]